MSGNISWQTTAASSLHPQGFALPETSQITVYFVLMAEKNLENMQRLTISDLLKNTVVMTFHFVIAAMDKWFR